MTLREHLDQFYLQYNIPENGGVADKTFEVPLPVFTLTLPNFSWRKRMLYIHDLEHVLNEQDTSWKGEIFIASWEISTGYYKNFPIIIFPLWVIGWGFWKHPWAVWRGFSKGCSDKGIACLNMEEEKLLNLDLAQLQCLTLNKRANCSKINHYFRFLIWLLISQLVFLFPIVMLVSLLFVFFKLLF
ncbi:MAG: hypothetical protein QM800_05445 [Paludibacter sp.]